MTDKIKDDITTIYDKMQKDTAESLKKYTESINTLEKQSKRFWAIGGIKEALFWCMCMAILLILGRETLAIYEVILPVMVWQIAYPCVLLPLVFYIIRVIAEKQG